MESGMLFYWLSWIFWIITTFFIKKSLLRTVVSGWILLVIIGSTIYVPIGVSTVSAALLILLAGSALLYTQLTQMYYALFASFTVTIGYTAILIWEKITPIWFILPRELLISIVLCLLLTMMSEQFIHRLLIGLLGISFGEIFYSFMLSSYSLQSEIGHLQFLDQAAVMVLFLLPTYYIPRIKNIGMNGIGN
ncbi:YphA family membrane protein [Virgibacillus sp. W0430]|uniref:YphA family membrane protein n=1 Tax=Virgibacillus sp. W0430 TaxID=3391580 RepID=UPI003F44DCB3